MLLAFGGAASLEEVEPFLRNVLGGRPVSEEMIERAKERYRLIGGGSPLAAITGEQAAALQARLEAGHPGLYRCYWAMRHWKPFIKDTLLRMVEDSVEEAAAVVMAPHSSRAATGGYEKDLSAALETTGGSPRTSFVAPWHRHPLFIRAVAANLSAALEQLRRARKVRVIFSAHSLPLATIEGDPYVRKLEETIADVTAIVDCRWRLAFQSRGAGPRPWLGPSVEEVMEEAAKEGFDAVALVPLGFTADHVETLYDIDIHFSGEARRLGLGFARSASLNASPLFIDALADVVTSHFEALP